jgi:hypothetical protein
MKSCTPEWHSPRTISGRTQVEDTRVWQDRIRFIVLMLDDAEGLGSMMKYDAALLQVLCTLRAHTTADVEVDYDGC